MQCRLEICRSTTSSGLGTSTSQMKPGICVPSRIEILQPLLLQHWAQKPTHRHSNSRSSTNMKRILLVLLCTQPVRSVPLVRWLRQERLSRLTFLCGMSKLKHNQLTSENFILGQQFYSNSLLMVLFYSRWDKMMTIPQQSTIGRQIGWSSQATQISPKSMQQHGVPSKSSSHVVISI